MLDRLTRIIGRETRIWLLPALMTGIILRELWLWTGRSVGSRIFFGGLVLALFHWWRMDRDDIRHLAAQEAAAIEDPKHLFNNDTGLRHHASARSGIGWSLVLMGMGVFFLAFEAKLWGAVFWGATLVMAGAILLILF